MRVRGAVLALASCCVHQTTAFTPSGAFNANNNGLVRVSPLRSTATAVAADTELGTLLEANRASVDALGKAVGEDVPEIMRLRYALAFETQIEAKKALRETMVWRAGEGKAIVEAAAAAVAAATANGGWDNQVVRDAAPHAAQINEFITPTNILTLSPNAESDLVYVIRASAIEDRRMMSVVTVEQMLDFFLYVKEVHNIIANARSARTGRLCQVTFANDISGVRQPPDSKFSQALSESSKQYEKFYPSLAGPTMILNLPRILQAFVGLIKPLFPKTVQARLKFERAPVLKSVTDMQRFTTEDDTRTAFLAEVAALLEK